MKSKSESTLDQPHIGVRFSVGLHPDAGLILGTIPILLNHFIFGKFLLLSSFSLFFHKIAQNLGNIHMLRNQFY